jgi:hypothetical protein
LQVNKIIKEITKEIKKVWSDQWIKFVEKCSKSTSTRPYWAKINQIRTGKVGGLMPNLKLNGCKYETDSHKAEILSELLASTFINSETVTEEKNVKVSNTADNFVNSSDSTNWGFELVQINEVVSALIHLNTNTAPGKDGILRNVKEHLILVHLSAYKNNESKPLREYPSKFLERSGSQYDFKERGLLARPK